MKKNSKVIAYVGVAVLSWSTVATAFKVALKSLNCFELILIASCTALLIFSVVIIIQKKMNLVRALLRQQCLRFTVIGMLILLLII